MRRKILKWYVGWFAFQWQCFTFWVSDTRHARFLRYVCAYEINWNGNCWFKKWKKKNSMFIFFGRLAIEEPEHLRMRWRNVWTREKNAVPPDTGALKWTRPLQASTHLQQAGMSYTKREVATVKRDGVWKASVLDVSLRAVLQTYMLYPFVIKDFKFSV